jgi:hypothetical protein
MWRPAHGGTTRPGHPRPTSGYGRLPGRPGPGASASVCPAAGDRDDELERELRSEWSGELEAAEAPLTR